MDFFGELPKLLCRVLGMRQTTGSFVLVYSVVEVFPGPVREKWARWLSQVGASSCDGQCVAEDAKLYCETQAGLGKHLAH